LFDKAVWTGYDEGGVFMSWEQVTALVGTVGLPLLALVWKVVPKRVSQNGHVTRSEFVELRTDVKHISRTVEKIERTVADLTRL
jgi:hypothetical protein